MPKPKDYATTLYVFCGQQDGRESTILKMDQRTGGLLPLMVMDPIEPNPGEMTTPEVIKMLADQLKKSGMNFYIKKYQLVGEVNPDTMEDLPSRANEPMMVLTEENPPCDASTEEGLESAETQIETPAENLSPLGEKCEGCEHNGHCELQTLAKVADEPEGDTKPLN